MTSPQHPRYPKGMVPDIEAHDARIIEIINETVKPGDEFWCLGDFRFIGGTRKEWRISAKEYLKKIRPKVHLIAGNHDDQAQGCAKQCREMFASYRDMAYIRRNGVKLFLFHYACRTWRGSNRGSIHLHGHSHGALPPLGRSMDVGIHNNNYRLLELDEIVAWAAEQPCVVHHPDMAEDAE